MPGHAACNAEKGDWRAFCARQEFKTNHVAVKAHHWGHSGAAQGNFAEATDVEREFLGNLVSAVAFSVTPSRTVLAPALAAEVAPRLPGSCW